MAVVTVAMPPAPIGPTRMGPNDATAPTALALLVLRNTRDIEARFRISYDRFINSDKIDVYISHQVPVIGTKIAEYAVKNAPKGNYVMVYGADTDNTLWNQPESWGLEAIAEGFRHLGLKDDHQINAAEWIVYDALYAYCQQCVEKGLPAGKFQAANQSAN